jgi:3-hydroxy-5-methyl-1-naphthoate 3-O-methyltransferase
MVSTQITKRMKELPPFDYREIDDRIFCAKYTYTLSLALETKLFEHLKTPKTAAQLSSDSGLNAWKLEKLCDFLVSFKLLTRNDDEFSLSELSKTFLLKDSTYSAVNLAKHSIMEALPPVDIAKMLKGESDQSGELWRYEEAAWKALFEAPFMGGVQRTMRILTNHLDISRIKSVLDLGGGPGTYSMAMAESFPNVSSIVVADLPSIVENSTAANLKAYGDDKIKSMPCDIRKDDIGSSYDLVFASNSLYMTKPEVEKVLSKIYKSLNSRGYLVLKHVFLDKSSTFSTSLDLAMSLASKEQNLHPVNEFEDMLGEAGFECVSILETEDPVYRDALMISVKKV